MSNQNLTSPTPISGGQTGPDTPRSSTDDLPDIDELLSGSGSVTSIPHRRRRRRSRTPWARFSRRVRKTFSLRIILTTLAVIAVVLLISGGVLVADASTQLSSSWTGLNRVLNNISQRSGTELTLADFDRLRISVNDLTQRLNVTRNRAQLASPLAALNADLRANLGLLDIAHDLTSATGDMLSGMQPTLFFLVAGEEEAAVTSRLSSGERVVELLEIGRGRFLDAQAQIDSASAALADLSLDGVSAGLLLNVAELEQYIQQVEDINTLLLRSPELLTTALGLDEDRNYLVIAQNNDEIRPSGGFIGTYGYFVVRGARVVEYDYRPSTVDSPNPPPDTFAESFDIPAWWFQYQQPVFAAWDGSWHVDFTETALLAASYYNAGRNPRSPVDGVISIDIDGFELLLGALGTVNVPGYSTPVTQSNFRDLVYDIRSQGGENPHKEFLAAMYRAIFSDWQTSDQQQAQAVLGAVLEALRTKHMMIAFVDEDLNALVDLLGWSGRQMQPGGDYLMMADANLGNKSDRSVLRDMTYDAVIQPDGSVESRLSLSYEYFASVASEDPAVDPRYHGPIDYRTLTQVHIAPGSQLIESSGTSRVREIIEEGRTFLVTQFQVSYDSAERLQFNYRTPPVVESFGEFQRYQLRIQKQAGSQAQPVDVQIALPPGARLISASPELAASYNLETTILDFRLNLETDILIEVIFATE